MKSEANGADIEIIERVPSMDDYGNQVLVPNAVRINGTEMLIPADSVIRVSDISNQDAVTVNVTLICRSLSIKAESETTENPSFGGKVVHVTRDIG